MIKQENKKESGRILSYFSGVAKIEGLAGVFLHETLLDEKGLPVALVMGFDSKYVEAIFFKESFNLKNLVYRSHKSFSINISASIIGRITNGLGNSIDGLGQLLGEEKNIFVKAPQIIDREPVTQSLSTGIKVIDTTLPLGRGQRELIIGDRKLGKSTLAIDTVLNQKNAKSPVYCIYVLCGQKEQKLKRLLNIFEKNNAFLYSTVVAAQADSTFAEKYLAPFVGCAIGEYFRDQGKDALVIYDDLTQHAKAYRDITLLLERAPGRETYPGDIFSLHAFLLERAAKLSSEKGGGSLSALPIIETQEEDITAFIPTNLISITDGQIYFERGLFQKRFLPAVNVGLSVSRVGSKTQKKPLREVTKGLRLALAQHKELQKLSQLETVKSKEATKKIHQGELLLELLKQNKHINISWVEQAILFYVVEKGYFDDLEKDKWNRFEELFLKLLEGMYSNLLENIDKNGFSDENKEQIEKVVNDFKREFLS